MQVEARLAPALEPPGQHTAGDRPNMNQKLSLLIHIPRCSALAKSTPALKTHTW